MVLYDGACPGCIKDMHWYRSHQRKDDTDVVWLDISGQDQLLVDWGISPLDAMLELHVIDQQGDIVKEIPAYRLLLRRLPGWHWLALIIALPGVRSLLGALYRRWVKRRLCRAGRL